MDGADFYFVMRERLFFLSGIFGIAALAVTLMLALMAPRDTGPLPPGFITPVMAFEFAATESEVYQLFQPPGSAEAMDQVTRWDFLFMALYGLLLFTFALAVARRTGHPGFYFAAALAPLIPLADALENVQLFDLTYGLTLDGGSLVNELEWLRLFTRLKWGGLAAYFLLLTPYFRMMGGRWRALELFFVLPAIFALVAAFNRGLANELMALSTGLLFVVLTVESWRQVIAGRQAMAEQQLIAGR